MLAAVNETSGFECVTANPKTYRITIRGNLSERFTSVFPAGTVESGGGKTTFLSEFCDQAQLWGLLERVQDFGLELVRVEEVS